MTNRLKDLRDAAGLTQAEVADRLGMSLSGYQRKETAKRGMNLTFAERLGRVLGVTATAVLEAASSPASVSPEEAEVLRLWGKSSRSNRDAIMRMLRLSAAEGEGAPAHASAVRFASGQGFEAPEHDQPARKPHTLHDKPDAEPRTKLGKPRFPL